MLSVIYFEPYMLSYVMVNVAMLSVVMLNVVAPLAYSDAGRKSFVTFFYRTEP
jgi:hypothetical protein